MKVAKFLKSFFSITFLALFLATSIASCGSGGESNTDAETTEDAPVEEMPVDEETPMQEEMPADTTDMAKEDEHPSGSSEHPSN